MSTNAPGRDETPGDECLHNAFYMSLQEMMSNSENPS